MAYQRHDWHHKGHSCCTPFTTCLLAWCCPCILYGKTRHRVKTNGKTEGFSSCNSSCLAFCGLSCLGVSFILPMISRGDMRAKYHLEGNGCTDCLCACCCAPCDLVQQDKEAAHREGNGPAPTTKQPEKVTPMAYPPTAAQSPPQQGHYVHQSGHYVQQPGHYAQQPGPYAQQPGQYALQQPGQYASQQHPQTQYSR